MHRLIIAVVAVFLITSSAQGQNTAINYGVKADKILAEGKILHVSHKARRGDNEYVFVVAYRGKIFSCHYDLPSLECENAYGSPVKIIIKDKKK